MLRHGCSSSLAPPVGGAHGAFVELAIVSPSSTVWSLGGDVSEYWPLFLVVSPCWRLCCLSVEFDWSPPEMLYIALVTCFRTRLSAPPCMGECSWELADRPSVSACLSLCGGGLLVLAPKLGTMLESCVVLFPFGVLFVFRFRPVGANACRGLPFKEFCHVACIYFLCLLGTLL